MTYLGYSIIAIATAVTTNRLIIILIINLILKNCR